MTATALSNVIFGTLRAHKVKLLGMAAMALLFFSLGSADWQPRTGWGWQVDHFVAYFAVTLLVCYLWPRPFVATGVLMVAAAVLEGLQALTPDRHPNLVSAFCGAGGALAAALLAEALIRARRKWAQAG